MGRNEEERRKRREQKGGRKKKERGEMRGNSSHKAETIAIVVFLVITREGKRVG